MENTRAAEIRNFAIVGHASSGKTTLAEAILMTAGAIGRMGRIADGSTASDYHSDEKERQISVQSSILRCNWQNKQFTMIDAPGYLDFVGETLGSLRVADLAVVVVHAQHGVSIGTDRVWKFATEDGIPKIIVINAVDKQNEHFEQALADCRAHYGEHGVFPLTLPINPGPGFNQTLDVMRSEIVSYTPGGRGGYDEKPATGEWKDKVAALHKELIEHIAESDDTLLSKYFEQGSLSEEEFRAGIHQAFEKQLFIPVFCTSAESNVGVCRLMDFIAKYGSSPVDHESVTAVDADGNETEVKLTDGEPVVHVFKTMAEEHFGELSFFRVYSGTLRSGMDLLNSDRKSTERIGQIYSISGKERATVPEIGPGDIGAVIKLRNTHTGDTLCSPKKIVTVPKVVYPKPTIHASLKAEAPGEEDKIAAGLAALHQEDPTFVYRVDSELHQTILSAQGELHLEVLVQRLRRRFNVHVDLAEPSVPFRETIQGAAESKYRHKKQSGGSGQFAEVWMRISAGDRDSGVDFKESLTGQNVDRNFVPSVERGVKNCCTEGVLAGYRVTDVKIDFYDGKMHPVDSNDISFQIAGYFAFKEAFQKARPRLLEPIHSVEIRIPEDCMGKVIGDLSHRRGKVLGIESEGQFQVVKAEVPAKELYRYSSVVRSLTAGRGVHSEEFVRYEEMPRELEQKLIDARATQKNSH